MIVIGITGTLGAGKGTVVEYLIERYGFKHYSVRDFLTRKLKEQGLDVNRDTMTVLANRLRAEHSPSYVTDCLYDEAARSGKNCIIESIRTPGEIESLRSKGSFTLFAVDADRKLRYERITERKSATDAVSFETFVQNEEREMETNDPNKQNLRRCIEMADYVLYNNNSIDKLYEQLGKILPKTIT